MSEDTAIIPVVARTIWENDKVSLSGVPNAEMSDEKRQVHVRDTAKQASIMGDRLGLVQGELLYEIQTRKYWEGWGFTSFDEYVEKELDFKRRKAYYLIKIYDKFVRELDLPIDILKEIEWAKAKELVPIVTKDNWKSLLKKTKKMTVGEITRMVKEKTGKIKEGEKFLRQVFSLSEGQYANVQNALALAADMTGSSKPGNLIDLICSDFLAGKITEEEEVDVDEMLERADRHIKNMERAFGIVLKIEKLDGETIPAFKEGEEGESA